MKKILTLLFALALMACSTSRSEETSSQDSTAIGDTTAVPAASEEAAIEEVGEEAGEEVSGDTSKLEITFDETAGLIYERHDLFYTVSIVTSEYEASSDVTWYFDADISPVYFKESWSAEGNEGSTEFFIDAESGDVACAYTEDPGAVEKWCLATGGIRTRFDGESDESTVELLPSDYGTNAGYEIYRKMDILKAILKEAEKSQEDETSYTFRIDKTSLIGGNEVAESTEVNIPKKVYDLIMGS